MSNYYEYREVKVMIALELMKRDGWTVYGYRPDESDSMTDYYSPAYWGGIAEKNGYVLVVGHSFEGKERVEKVYTDEIKIDSSVAAKIEKLKKMTVARGASEAEEATAKKSIEKLMLKQEEEATARERTAKTVTTPGHLANPPRCNWHIEKDGLIIAKGSGLLKFSEVYKYFYYESYRDDMMKFKRLSRSEFIEEKTKEFCHYWNHNTEEEARKSAEYRAKSIEEDEKLFNSFNSLIGMFDTTAGGMMGNAEFEYVKKTVTKYKKENVAEETNTGSIKEGQCYILKVNFNYGCRKGYVYRIHESSFKAGTFCAVRLDGKLKKELTGTANTANRMFFATNPDEIQKFIDRGSIAFVNIVEKSIPYEVEKVEKRPLKKAEKPETVNKSGKYTYDISEDTDTRNGSKIWIVKIAESLSRDEYAKENKAMKERGGYYSRFKHGFLFKTDPSEILCSC